MNRFLAERRREIDLSYGPGMAQKRIDDAVLRFRSVYGTTTTMYYLDKPLGLTRWQEWVSWWHGPRVYGTGNWHVQIAVRELVQACIDMEFLRTETYDVKREIEAWQNGNTEEWIWLRNQRAKWRPQPNVQDDF